MKTQIGLNFSPWYSECLGLNWKLVLDELIELKPEVIRISANLNRLYKEGELDFSELDYIIQKLIDNDIKIILTVGIKAQRYPEYFLPAFIIKGYPTLNSFLKDLDKDPDLQNQIFKIITEIVNRYKNKVSIWQVENEALQQSVPFSIQIGNKFLKNEIELVKALTGNNKILLNETVFTNTFLSFLQRLGIKLRVFRQIKNLGEINAANIYFIIAQRFGGFKLIFRSNMCLNDENYDYITELQAEPWPTPNVDNIFIKKELWKLMQQDDWNEIRNLVKNQNIIPCKAEDSNESFNSNIIEKSFSIVKSAELNLILFWGAEFWIFKKNNGDSSWIKKYKDLIQTS